MKTASSYTARKPDASGLIDYPDSEHEVWSLLYNRQMTVIIDRACPEYHQGLDLLGLTADRIPQLPELDAVLQQTTGWSVARVPALISFDRFFQLLANRQFPAATFIRRKDELDYLQEPDIFHEVFGHCPLLTNPDFAALTEVYGKMGLAASKEERVYLARLYWMTVEFGLVQSGDSEGLKIYGGGILSSHSETLYALDSDQPVRKAFDLIDVLRTPYRIDILQPVYFIIPEFHELKSIVESDIMEAVREAMKLGMHKPLF
ncbi:phenylalanine 4-monooxygenase [Endozoicomonas sp. OPT23]|uniref:phenylalanine 4-monooxygenase n=1 Tax=Endozoicomonas sp. OPT23 TaxID=2072845 RepID=UPI00129ACF4B|nr:phenylalanine 4-monooxygenase [Endozoicomonas sp. OPT23]MRI34385.1 phenylalanine 4-monooxygenase [Endozoicomonas sp. OPT23]